MLLAGVQAPRPHWQVASRVGLFIASPGGLLCGSFAGGRERRQLGEGALAAEPAGQRLVRIGEFF
jgi:hypothetical protein